MIVESVLQCGACCACFLTLLCLVCLAKLGVSFVSVWVGYEFVLTCGASIWIVMGVITGARFWIEAGIVAEILSLAVPLWHLFFSASE